MEAMSSSGNRILAEEACRKWSENFRIGQDVIFEGKPHKTESHAGSNYKGQPCVFISGVEEPVPLDRLEVPGWVRSNKKR